MLSVLTRGTGAALGLGWGTIIPTFPTFVGQFGVTTASTTTTATTASFSYPANSLLVALVGAESTTTQGSTFSSSVSSSNGLTWSYRYRNFSQTMSNGYNKPTMAYTYATTAGSTTVTATYSTTFDDLAMCVLVFTGVSPTNPFPGSLVYGTNGTATTAFPQPPNYVTAAQATTLIIWQTTSLSTVPGGLSSPIGSFILGAAFTNSGATNWDMNSAYGLNVSGPGKAVAITGSTSIGDSMIIVDGIALF